MTITETLIPKFIRRKLSTITDNTSYEEALNVSKDLFLVVFMYSMKSKKFFKTMRTSINLQDGLLFCKSLSSMITHLLIEVEQSPEELKEVVKNEIEFDTMITDLYQAVKLNNCNYAKYKFIIDSVEYNGLYLEELYNEKEVVNE